MILSVSHLSVVLGQRLVLDDVTVEFPTGQFTGLIGPNGAGKTTLLRTILGLQQATSGEVTVEGTLAYVPQKSEMDWSFPLSVRHCIANGRVGLTPPWRRDPEATHIVDTALHHVALDDYAHRPIGALSGGQRQRVLVARALAMNPEILILDEPFTGVDMPTQDLLLGLFTGLAQKGVTIVMSTHDLGSAMDTCQHLVMLNRTIRADAPPQDLYDAHLWMDTFHVNRHSPLLRQAGVIL